ncbi:hypothetical protein L6452_27988 [Arctium lappa]|uniref:Uncharacterized protein n=1 Tax=Arctium lappa TaxID=4217 RepID=A0ACB8ZXP5_ARCLA|nr:hypothetical protein L6452_27988 [Arctium lappa]
MGMRETLPLVDHSATGLPWLLWKVSKGQSIKAIDYKGNRRTGCRFTNCGHRLVKSSRKQGLLRQEQALDDNSKRFPVTLRKSNYGYDSMKVYVETAKVEANIVSYKIAQSHHGYILYLMEEREVEAREKEHAESDSLKQEYSKKIYLRHPGGRAGEEEHDSDAKFDKED